MYDYMYGRQTKEHAAGLRRLAFARWIYWLQLAAGLVVR